MKLIVPRIVLIAAQVFFAILIAAVITTPANAHAVLKSSSPKNNAVLQTSPQRMVLQFDARIEKTVTQVTLLDGKSQQVPLHLTPNWYTAGSPDQLIIPLPSLKPGNYQINYRIMATDGHITPGFIRFTVSERKPS